MNNEKKMNNKGFSLVELIIVIAIMAVLIGVLAPQYMRYLERSRVAVDRELASNLQSAITTALLDPAIKETDKPGVPTSNSKIGVGGTNNFWKDVYETLGVDDADKLLGKLKSKAPASLPTGSSSRLDYEIDDNGNVIIHLVHEGGTEAIPDNSN